MRAALSIIIPTLNAEASLGPCLSALAEGLSAGLIRELVIADGGSSDATRRIAEEAGAVVVTAAPSRGGQLRAGAEAASGVHFLFLHADTLVQPGWANTVARAISENQSGYGWLEFDAQGLRSRWVAGWANLRSRLFGLPYGDQGLLISKDLYHSVGGFPDQPLMEDVGIARRLRGHLRPLGFVAQTSAEKYQREGWASRGGRNLWTLTRYMMGADPAELAQSYRRKR